MSSIANVSRHKGMTVKELFHPKSFANYQEWHDWAIRKDQRSGKLKWRSQEETDLYDYIAIRRRLDRLHQLKGDEDPRGLLFALHEGLHGNMGGMGKNELYQHARSGTKHLIEEYVNKIVECLHYINSVPSDSISEQDKWEFFERADHCYGSSALMLSGGALMGWYHYGVTKALLENNVLPSVISGSSAGSIVAGVLGTHTDDELGEMFDTKQLLIDATYEVDILNRIFRPRKQRITHRDLLEMINHLIPDLTFEEALYKTGRHINISIAPVEAHQTSRLLNAITTPNVYIRSAVQASCAVPGFLSPVTLKAKNFSGEHQDYLPSRQWCDGTMTDDLPAKRLSRLYGVNHYIVSQVNPHIAPFIRHFEKDSLVNTLLSPYRKFAMEWIKTVQKLNTHLPTPAMMKALFSTADTVVNQKYTADINIILDPRLISPLRLLSKPTVDEVIRLLHAGEQATWPKIPQIENSTKISRAIKDILNNYAH